jgi:hypothetical protein
MLFVKTLYLLQILNIKHQHISYQSIMQKLSVILLGLCISFSAMSQSESGYGQKITKKGAIAASKLPAKMGNKENLKVKVTGEVESVCQVKGCWMKVTTTEGQTMRVIFKDYAFFVPKDISGKTVTFEGEAQNKVVSVDHLKHYAQDAGKSKAEIAQITEPSQEITFVATGVIVE